ncbi:MAG: hypothetical protein JRD49_11520 [Deltaproteobacteria bacterium]|nr:hypothetical protein [Deltaproteobacteria bacterium]
MTVSNESHTFNPEAIKIVNSSAAMAEELVSNFYKMSASEWLHPKYDVKTRADLTEDEIVDGPFAQVIRYEGQLKDTSLGSTAYDFYKICLQDHAILAVLDTQSDLKLFPFVMYIITHELIHIVRFSKFLQNFDASAEERVEEEKRVHKYTHAILNPVRLDGVLFVLQFYKRWRSPIDGLKS